MTDLTAAQLVERLRYKGYTYQMLRETAATLIEQQAEHLDQARMRVLSLEIGQTATADKLNAANGLIEQQAEQIAGQADEIRERIHHAGNLFDRADKAESEAAALRKVIEDAPHVSPCVYYAPTRQVLGEPCTCWKSKALPKKETP